MGGNVSFKIDESKLNSAHDVVDNETLSSGYIHQVEKNGQLKQIDDLQSVACWSTKLISLILCLYTHS